MLVLEERRLFTQSQRVASRLFPKIKAIRKLQPFKYSKFSVIANGLAMHVHDAAYEGQVFITENEAQQVNISFVPGAKKAEYLETCMQHLDTFATLLT